MIRKNIKRVSVFLLLAGFLIITPEQGSAHGQSKGSSLRKTQVRTKTQEGGAQRQYEVGQALDLNLAQCFGEINLPSVGISADGLEISGGNVSLLSGGTVIKLGEVIAYAQSKYFLDSNVAFIFDRSRETSKSPEWKPPVIISLNLVQDRKNPKRFVLSFVPIGASPGTRISLSCGNTSATAR
jgi:hypothetical protein